MSDQQHYGVSRLSRHSFQRSNTCVTRPLSPCLEESVFQQPLGNTMSRMIRRRARGLQASRRLEPRVTSYGDIVWQKDPDRLLKYRPFNLHYYGWMPFLVLRNVKATVFSDIYLYVQVVVLLLYVALLHSTGLGIATKDLESFVKMVGTSYVGALLNPAMVITFILGLFTTLVINRWSGVLAAYGKILSGTLDLCMSLSHVVHNEQDWEDVRAERARTELTRLLNLGHVLVITSADSQADQFKRARGLKTFARYISRLFRPQANLRSTFLEGRRARDVSYRELVEEGLVNPDEWNLLLAAEQEGMSSYQTVYFWAQSILHKCKAAEFIIHEQQMLPMLLNKLNSIVESASQVTTLASSQMPYPYVHLVSFVAHFYLILCSTWFGCFLHVGYPLGDNFHATSGNGIDLSISQGSRKISGYIWSTTWCYGLVALAVILFQGLLNMHSLVDNPFGSHCAMFPLRQHISEAVNSSRAMLKQADKLPQAFGDIFRIAESSSDDEDDDDPQQTADKYRQMRQRRSARRTFLSPRGGFSIGTHASKSSIVGFEDSSSESELDSRVPDAIQGPPKNLLSNWNVQEDATQENKVEKSWKVDVEES